MNILKFNLHDLHNEELYQFCGEVKKLGDEVELSKVDIIKAVYALFVQLFGRLGDGLEQVRKSEHTADLHDADHLRDNIYHGLTLLVQAYLRSPIPAKAAAARSIQIVIDTYGKLAERGFTEETATIINFLETIEQRCKAQVELIGGTEFVAALDKANKDFDALMGMRFDEHAGQERINIRQTRRELEDAYGKLAYLVEALGQLHPEMAATIDSFIGRLNDRITYFRDRIAQRKSLSEKKKVGEEKPDASL